MKKIGMMLIVMVAIGFLPSGTVDADEQFMAIKKITGEAWVKSVGDEEWRPATFTMGLHEGDEIKTGEASKLIIMLGYRGKEGFLEVQEQSLLRIRTAQKDLKTDERETLIDLAIGRVIVHGDRRKGDSKFKIVTPTSTTDIEGMLFEVEVE